MRLAKNLMVCAGAVMMLGATGVADWFPGDPHKMHFPQLPDPFGWDVNATFPKVLADDWRCSESGPVTDVHVWGSWENDIRGEIAQVHVSIHSDIPATPTTYSRPGDLLWERDFFPGEFSVLDPWGTGQQGWYDPNTGLYEPGDHFTFNQINIERIPDPFVQELGTIYWLDISVIVENPAGADARWGWKTSLDHFNDDGVWGDFGTGVMEWNELRDPITQESLDLAFVITPAPSALPLLAIGGALVAGRRRRR